MRFVGIIKHVSAACGRITWNRDCRKTPIIEAKVQLPVSDNSLFISEQLRHCREKVIFTRILFSQVARTSKCFYHPLTKLREGNVFTRVCLFIGGGSLVPPYPLSGTIPPSATYLPSPPPHTCPSGTIPPGPQKQTVFFLLECSLVILLSVAAVAHLVKV